MHRAARNRRQNAPRMHSNHIAQRNHPLYVPLSRLLAMFSARVAATFQRRWKRLRIFTKNCDGKSDLHSTQLQHCVHSPEQFSRCLSIAPHLDCSVRLNAAAAAWRPSCCRSACLLRSRFLRNKVFTEQKCVSDSLLKSRNRARRRSLPSHEMKFWRPRIFTFRWWLRSKQRGKSP